MDKWTCKYYVHDDCWDGEEEWEFTGCQHPKGNGGCVLEKGKDSCSLHEED